LEEKLRLMVAELELQSNVSFLGSMGVKQLAERYASATAFVLPSTSEPWGLVVNEALSHGCPAVVSQVCGCVPELVVPGVTGYSFQAGSVSELHTQMLAAATQFSNIERTAQDCLQLMQQFTPENAARQIMLGAKVILDESRKSSHR
jgi:glycosyltransferase involved in cell wall biosynthesis